MLTLPTVIAALPDDDRRAFIEALWQKYHSYMFFIARRYYLGAEVLEDVVSDSLLRLMERTETLRELTPPQTFAYIRRTVRSQAVERARKERRERMLENSGWTVEADALMDDWKRVELEEELEALMDAGMWLGMVRMTLSTSLPRRHWS